MSAAGVARHQRALNTARRAGFKKATQADSFMPPPVPLTTLTVWLTSRGEAVGKGDPVLVSGMSGRFNFVDHTTNEKTGQSWVSVYGGDKDVEGRRQFRCVAPERVRLDRKLQRERQERSSS